MKALHLALLSTLRKHDVQTLLMLRYALESSVLACYSLYDKNPDNYAVIDADGLLNVKENIKRKAYSWIHSNYEEHSNKIKYFKDSINSTSAHANFGPIFYNTDFSEAGKIFSYFFDNNLEDFEHHVIMTKQRLWWIGNISFGLLDMVYKAISQYPLVEIVDDFSLKMHHYGKENERIKKELKLHPRFSRNIL